MRHRGEVMLFLVGSCSLCGVGYAAVPPGFSVEDVYTGFTKPVGLDVAADGRVFVIELGGKVFVIDNGVKSLFLDLSPEVGVAVDRGMIGIQLDPNFMDNHLVYLLYTVDPIYGRPDEGPGTKTFGRLTRYTGTTESQGSVADPDSRLVLLGEKPADGFPECHASHHVGAIRFGGDGNLYVSSGDGSHYEVADAGGLDPDCFVDPLFSADQDLGSFRSQYLGSLAGKILRLDPRDGKGLADNPFFTGNPDEPASKVWAYGFRNPVRFTFRPRSGSPGVIYASDVGWFTYEEVNVLHGGENCGWPCYESPLPAPQYPATMPKSSGCDTIGTAENPGTLTDPIIWWHHGSTSLSFPQGYKGNCSITGVFYEGGSYPTSYTGKLFVADHIQGWVKLLEVDGEDRFAGLTDFGTGLGGITEFAEHPVTHDLYYVTISNGGKIRHIVYSGVDLDGDGLVNGADLGLLLANWGGTGVGDLNHNGTVDGSDLGLLLSGWTG